MSSRTRRRDSSHSDRLKKEILFEIYGIGILSLSVIEMARYGAIGRSLTYLSRFVIGTWDFIIPLLGVVLGIYVMIKRRWPRRWSPRLTGVFVLVFAFLTWIHYQTFQAYHATTGIIDTTWKWLLADMNSDLPVDVGGGMTGAIGYALLHFLFDDTGTLIVLGALVLVGILLVTGFSYGQAFKEVKVAWHKKTEQLKDYIVSMLQKNPPNKTKKKRLRSFKEYVEEGTSEQAPAMEKPIIIDFEEKAYIQANVSSNGQMKLPLDPIKPATKVEAVKVEAVDEEQEPMDVRFQTEINPEYRVPPLHLLRPQRRSPLERENVEEVAERLVRTLTTFGVQAKVGAIHRGPTVTRYELQPDVGVRVNKIVSLSDDIALALAAKGLRIEAPIPGKAAVGIEIPNMEKASVSLRDILESPEYQIANSKVSIALGRDISGAPIIDDLTRMPHLLVAGATGSGKSVCINVIITSLLFKAKPNEVKLMMIDPKMVELNIYNGIPHLLAPVVTDPRKAAVALKKVVAEMEKRYELFAKNGARDIERYNQIVHEQPEKEIIPLPYIVVVVDELADLMMVAPAEVEDAICRLAQMARAAGIHLIIATQRPSVDVITGLIKANIPSRIAFAVSSQVDSRTIIDKGGAERLLGKGDMLYLPVGEAEPIRVQGAFLSDDEVEAVVQFVKTQQEAHYNEEMIPSAPDHNSMDDLHDDLLPQAIQVVIEAKIASASLIQRRLRVGYARAARLIDIMEHRGMIGPHEGTKPREVLITLEEFKEKKSLAR